MIKTILYDLDGVLVAATDWHYESLNRALLDAAGYSISRDEHITTYNGLPTKIKLSMLMEMGIITASQAKKVWEDKQRHTIETIQQQASTDFTKIKLHAFTSARDIRSACVTNSIRETAELMLVRTGQRDFMSLLVTNDDVHKQKPDPEPYLYAMRRLQVSPVDTLIVEDSDKGYQSAFASGAKVLRVDGCGDVTLEVLEKHLT